MNPEDLPFEAANDEAIRPDEEEVHLDDARTKFVLENPELRKKVNFLIDAAGYSVMEGDESMFAGVIAALFAFAFHAGEEFASKKE